MTWAASWQLWWLHALMLGMGEKRFYYNLEWWQKAWVGHFRPPYAIFSRLELIDPFFTTREVNLFRSFLWKNSPPCNFYSCALYGITMIVYINHFPFSALTNALLYCTTHHGPAVSRFLVSNGSTNGAECLRGLLRLIKTHFENISGCPFWDRDPRYPNRVPWNQKKIIKKFIMEIY